MTQKQPQSAMARALAALAAGRSLTRAEAGDAFDQVMRGEATHEELKALLLGLRARGESADEVAGAAQALRRAMTALTIPDVELVVDTCGTGGGTVGTVNVSTGAAFIVAGAGVAVAKHGNRSFTSRSGSADVLEALGISLSVPPERIAAVLAHANVAFLFAPAYHPAMRHAAPVRRELGVATIMNLLGPLANPAGVKRQVLGVSDPARGPLLAEALLALGAVHALVVHARAGMDELSPAGISDVWEVRDGAVHRTTLDPASLGIRHDSLEGLAGGEPAENAAMLEAALRQQRAGVILDALLLNAAAALHVSGRGWTLDQAMERARESVASGRAWAAVERLRDASAP